MGLRESLKKLQEQEKLDKTMSLKREVKKELTKIKHEKILEKKCIECSKSAAYSIKGSNEWYCKDCAIEYFGDLKHLKKVNTSVATNLKNSKIIYFITGNSHKFESIQRIIPGIQQLNIDLDEIQDIDAKKIIEHKLLDAKNKVKKGTFIVEDTSLYFDCLNGLPGPLVKFFIKSIGDKGLYEITKNFGNDKAEARTLIGYYNKGKIKYFQGIVKGRIIKPTKPPTVGWDTIFVPDGEDIPFVDMTLDEKSAISMRGIAARKLLEHLKETKKI